MIPKPSDWLLVIVLPGMFIILAIGLFLVMRKVFKDSDEAAKNPIPVTTSSQPANLRLLWMGLGLGMLAVTFALVALLVVAWNIRR